MRTILLRSLLSGCFISLLAAPLAASEQLCIAQRKPNWKTDEVRVWAALCRGEKLDFGQKRGTLRGAFLHEVLSEPLSSAWGHRLDLSNVVVQGDTDLSGLEVSHEIRILDSTFNGAINGSSTKFKGDVCLQGSNLLGDVDFSGSRIDGGLYLGDEADKYRCGPEPIGTPIINIKRRRISKLRLDSLHATGDIYVRNFITDNFIKAELAESEKNIFFWYCSAPGINLTYANTDRLTCPPRNSP